MLADVVHLHHVGVGELAQRARLAQQEPARPRVAARRVQQLDGDAPIELGIVGAVDLAHAAAAQQRQHQVAADRGAAAQQAIAGIALVVRRHRRGDEAPARLAPVEVGLDLAPSAALEPALEQHEELLVVEARRPRRGYRGRSSRRGPGGHHSRRVRAAEARREHGSGAPWEANVSTSAPRREQSAPYPGECPSRAVQRALELAGAGAEDEARLDDSRAPPSRAGAMQ